MKRKLFVIVVLLISVSCFAGNLYCGGGYKLWNFDLDLQSDSNPKTILSCGEIIIGNDFGDMDNSFGTILEFSYSRVLAGITAEDNLFNFGHFNLNNPSENNGPYHVKNQLSLYCGPRLNVIKTNIINLSIDLGGIFEVDADDKILTDVILSYGVGAGVNAAFVAFNDIHFKAYARCRINNVNNSVGAIVNTKEASSSNFNPFLTTINVGLLSYI